MGLADWTVRQGLAAKLSVTAPEEIPGVVRVPPGLGGGWIDVERSATLTGEVYSYRGLKDRAIWPDLPSANIPLQFQILFLQLADALAQLGGEDETAGGFLAEADSFGITAAGGSRRARGE